MKPSLQNVLLLRQVCATNLASASEKVVPNSCKAFGEVEKMRRDSEKYTTDHSRDANRNAAAHEPGRRLFGIRPPLSRAVSLRIRTQNHLGKSMKAFSLALFASMFWLGTACAADKVNEKRVAADTADTPEKFEQLTAAVHQEMAEGGHYEFIRPDAKAQVDSDLAAMSALMQKAGSVAQMNQDDKIQLFNRQEHVNGILTHNDSNRLICERRSPVGSNIPITMCKTVGEIEHERRKSQKFLDDQLQVGNKSLIRGG